MKMMPMINELRLAGFAKNPAVLEGAYIALGNLVPPPDMKPSEWSEANISIGMGNAVPGPIRFDAAPYQRGMIDVIKEPGINRVTYMTGAQLGKTTIQQCITAYFIAHEPRSQIFMMPSQGDVQTFQETKLKPMLDANPDIAKVMAKPRGRDGVNNSRVVSFNGGFLFFAWAGSTKTLRSRSAPVTHADEIDNCEATTEGSPLELLAQRSATFSDQRLRTESSTPTVKGFSAVEACFMQGDQRRFYVPCPSCGQGQHLKWEQVRWNGRRSASVREFENDLHDEHEPETAGYQCEFCDHIWNDGERIAAIRSAEKLGFGWKATRPTKNHASFHAPELLSTFRRLRDIVQSYLDKLAQSDIQSFVNVSLGEPHEEQAEKADPDSLIGRCRPYPAQIPAGAVYLTCGIDMQMDRLELEIVGWGVGEQSWSIDYKVIWGDPLGDDPWDQLDDILAETYIHESGAQLTISAACLDTGGTNGYTQRAYDYARGKTGRKLFAIKGMGGWGNPIVRSPQRKQSGKNKRKVDLFIVGTDEAKLVVMRRLAVQKPGPGYCHFPEGRDPEYFQQLTAERMVTEYVKGQPIRKWTKPDRARNEALDCRVYATAALKIMQPSLKRLSLRLNGSKPKPEAPAKPPALEPIQPIETPTPANDNDVIIIRKKKPQDERKTKLNHNEPTKKKRIFGNTRR